MARLPLGGLISWGLQWIAGFARLGLDVYVVEKVGPSLPCYDPRSHAYTDDCSFGIKAMVSALEPFGLAENWCFATEDGEYFGMTRAEVEETLARVDVFLDLGAHGTWHRETENCGVRVIVDGDPGWWQMGRDKALRAGTPLPEYDRYFTNGLLVGTEKSSAPTLGLTWEPTVNPVLLDLYPPSRPPEDGPFRTVMHWNFLPPLVYDGITYGQKDVEFRKFLTLPRLTDERLELAIGARPNSEVPFEELAEHGWRTTLGRETTVTLESFGDYVRGSKGEFGVCKEYYVAPRTGWFSDRSAAFLASGRPVVLQETGFSEVLPTGRGLLSFSSVTDAAAAMDEVASDLTGHSEAARSIAESHLSTDVVLPRFLARLGL